MDLNVWLQNTPNFTTFRLNKLKNAELNILIEEFKLQALELNAKYVPRIYCLKRDCLVVEQWPKSLELEKSGTEVIVDAACAAAVLRGAHVFAPGVLGLPTNCIIGQRVDIYGDLEKKCKRGFKCQYEGSKVFGGIGILKMLRKDLFDNGIQPSGIAVQTLLPASRLPVVNQKIFPEGSALLQNLPSIVCGWVVDAKANEIILDMCAAPGNKTTHLAEMSDNQAHIIAIDRTAQKVEKIKELCTLHGITCVKAYPFDSTKAHSENASGIFEGPPFPSNSFDKILLDGPCSGLGQRPLLCKTMTEKELSSYKYLQRKLLTQAVKLLKPGGRLTYSTCTVTTEENEYMVAWALETFHSLTLVAAHPLLGGPGYAGCGLTNDQRILVQRFGPELDPLRLPDPIYRDTIGFFIACFEKSS